jgi:hypothetical protein
MYSFSKTTVTIYYNPDDLKQQKFLLSQFQKLEVNQSVIWAMFHLKALEKSLFSPPPVSSSPRALWLNTV